MQYPRSSGHQGGGMLAALDAAAARFYSEEGYLLVSGKWIESADGIAASADTGDHDVRKPARRFHDLRRGSRVRSPTGSRERFADRDGDRPPSR